MLVRSFATALLLTGVVACRPEMFGANPQVAGDDPSVNQMTSQRMKNMPFCPGGDRAKACILGTNCRVTEKGCQVCVCEAIDP